MNKIEFTPEITISDVTFIKDDAYTLEPGCFAQLREVVCAYQIKFEGHYTRYQLVVLKSRPVPNAPYICIEVYCELLYHKPHPTAYRDGIRVGVLW